MISSARQGCAKTASYTFVRPSWSLALHAESSSQALLRAAAARRPPIPQSLTRPPSHTAHSQARFSAAAAAVPQHELFDSIDDDDPPRISWGLRAARRSSERTAFKRAVDRPSPRKEARSPPPQATISEFRALTRNDSIAALLSLPTIPPDKSVSLTLTEIDSLLFHLQWILRRSRPPASADFDAIHLALVHLHALIVERPENSGTRLLVGIRLRNLIKICIVLGNEDLARSIWRTAAAEIRTRGEAAEEAETDGSRPSDAEMLVDMLAAHVRAWRMIVWMSGPDLLPDTLLTPKILARYMQAHLATHQPEAISALFRRHAKLGLVPMPDAYNAVLQAMLELGNMEGARAAAKKGREEGGLTRITQQLAILRGHRALGAGINLEERVMSDLKNIGEEPNRALINALVRLRLHDGDFDGADNLLARYYMESSQTSGDLEATADSFFLALRVAGRKRDMPRVERIWARLSETPNLMSDSHLAQLLYALDHKVGYSLVRSLLDPTLAKPHIPFKIPPSLRPGIRTLNALLNMVTKRNPDLDAVNKTLGLLPILGLPPDEQTIKLILEILSRAGSPPAELARALGQFLQQFPNLHPTIIQVNTILAASLRMNYYSGGPPIVTSDEPTDLSRHFGLESTKALQEHLAPILDELYKRHIPPNSTSLAIKLRYNALTHATSNGTPSADAVWADIIERGYRPNKRHVLALMSGYADSGAMSEAEKILRLAKHLEVEPTSAMWMTLLTGWDRQGNIPKALAAYRKIEATAGGADLVATCAMIHAYGRNGAYDRAAMMVHNVLIPRHGASLDQTGLVVAMRALQANNEEVVALALASKYMGIKGAISNTVRKLVMQIGKWLVKREKERVAAGRTGPAHAREARDIQRGLELQKWIKSGRVVMPPTSTAFRDKLLSTVAASEDFSRRYQQVGDDHLRSI